MLLAGIFPAVTTPFYADGRIYFRKLQDNIAHYASSPVAGVVVLGSTGEAVMLSDEERRAVLTSAAEVAPDGMTLIAGTGVESVRETVAMTEFAAAAGYDLALVRTPHYYRKQMTPLAMLTYYRAIADRSPLPVLLYSVPAMTAYDLPVEVVVDLAEHPNILGIKESSGSVEKVRELVHRTRQVRQKSKAAAAGADGSTAPAVSEQVGFQVLVGSAQTLLPSLEVGATGSVLAFAAAAPVACCDVYSAWKQGQKEKALQSQERIARAASRVGGELGVPGIKYAMDFNAYYGGVPRLPLLPVDAETRKEIEGLLENIRS